jgi:toxin ParE1/3/4
LSVFWLPEALRNRFEQLDFIAVDSPSAAADLDEEIEAQVDSLALHPRLGRPGRVKGTRELVVSRSPFVVVYRIKAGSRVEVLRLLHGAQQWPKVP